MVLNFDYVFNQAIRARDAFEKRSTPMDELVRLYAQYHPELLDVIGLLEAAAELFPAGNCGISALYLQDQLGTGEIVNGRFGLEEHIFLKLGSLVVARNAVLPNNIIDITADQFGGPPVYVGPLQPPWIE